MNRKPRILITRSEPGASETAGRVDGMGYLPIVEPLFAIEPIAAALPGFDALAFTSANGVREFARRNGPAAVPVFCVGTRTAEAAREAGFIDVSSAEGDVAALIQLIHVKLAPGQRLLHAGNEESRGDLAGRLRARGHNAEFVATFRAIPVPAPGPILSAHLASNPAFEAVLIHSPRAATILAGFALAAPGHAPIRAAAISAAAAGPLKDVAATLISPEPNEASLLETLGQLSFFD